MLLSFSCCSRLLVGLVVVQRIDVRTGIMLLRSKLLRNRCKDKISVCLGD